ncbi:MAG: hypothetical protein WBC44_10595 [Planctomycetaceae bacterium]
MLILPSVERQSLRPVRHTAVRRPLVYLAGPFSQPDPIENTHRMLCIADALLEAGFAPLVPHLSLAWHLVSPKPYAAWLDYDRDLLARCDVVLRVPGNSYGATCETEFAGRIGIPVVRPESAEPEECVEAVSEWFFEMV